MTSTAPTRRWIGFVLPFAALSAIRIVGAQSPKPVRAGSESAWRASADSLMSEPFDLVAYDGRRTSGERLRLAVPERYDHPSNRRVILSFVRLRATGTPRHAPVVFLAGGPGIPGVGMAQVPPYFDLFQRLRVTGDVILLDQRGTGQSTPRLDCDPAQPGDSTFFSGSAWGRGFREMTARCATAWRQRGVDLHSYTPDVSADDVNALREAIGAPQVALLAHSYGTVVAQSVLRRHGAHVERAVLAAVKGPDHLLASPSAWDAGLWKLGELAATTYGLEDARDLPQVYRQALDSLRAHPVRVPVVRQGDTVQVLAGPLALHALMRALLSDTRSMGRVPALLLAMRRGDYTEFRTAVAPTLVLQRSLMATAADCAQGWSPERRLAVERQQREAVFTMLNAPWESGVCRTIGFDKIVPPRARLVSRVSTLFLSGTLDLISPPYHAEDVRWGFAHSTHISVVNGGHETLPADAVQDVVRDFLDGGLVDGRTVVFAPPVFRPLPTPQ